ncbi:MAG TPA: hypothetical protein VGA49_02155 [Patescibacteria group bacterium]
MLEHEDLFQLLPEGLRFVSSCPICGVKFNPIQARIIDEKEDAHLIHIQCKKCHSCIIALIYTADVGVTSIGLITDLTAEDVIKFKSTDSIGSDDVIEVYRLLENSRPSQFIKLLN